MPMRTEKSDTTQTERNPSPDSNASDVRALRASSGLTILNRFPQLLQNCCPNGENRR